MQQRTKICENRKCQQPFPTTNSVQRFCCRKCFKTDYNRRVRETARKERENPKYAKRVCAFCQFAYEIPFDVAKYPKRFDEWRCPFCGVPNEVLWRNQNSPESHQLVFSIMLQSTQGNISTNFMQIFKL